MPSPSLESIEHEFRSKMFRDKKYEPRRWKTNSELRKAIDAISDTRFNSLNVN